MILWTEKVRAWIAFNLILLCFILLMIHHGCDSFSTSPIKEWFSLGKIFCFRKPDFLSFNLKLILKFSSSSGVVSFDLSALCKHSFTRTFAAFTLKFRNRRKLTWCQNSFSMDISTNMNIPWPPFSSNLLRCRLWIFSYFSLICRNIHK